MQRNRLMFINIMLASCFVIAIGFLVLIPQRLAIVFQPTHSNAKLAYILLNGETDFQIKYTHSIHLTDVVESYRITINRQIQQYELMYENFSIGMPSNAEEGERFEQINGKYYIKNMNRDFPYFYLRVGQVRANHRVIFHKKEYPLSRSVKPGTSVKVEIQKLSFFQQWKGVNILESL